MKTQATTLPRNLNAFDNLDGLKSFSSSTLTVKQKKSKAVARTRLIHRKIERIGCCIGFLITDNEIHVVEFRRGYRIVTNTSRLRSFDGGILSAVEGAAMVGMFKGASRLDGHRREANSSK